MFTVRCPKIIDVQDVDGQTALHVAAANGNLACVQILLEAGADSTLRDGEGLTPLQQAEKYCYPECAQVLEKKWKELEERARIELEELLRDEGIDASELYVRVMMMTMMMLLLMMMMLLLMMRMMIVNDDGGDSQ